MMMIIRNNILIIGMQFRCFVFTWLNSEFSLTYPDLKSHPSPFGAQQEDEGMVKVLQYTAIICET